MAEKYVVLELQKSNNQISSIVTSHDTLKEAQFKYYSSAASASISEIPLHTIVMISERGLPMERITFDREVAPEQLIEEQE